MKVWKKLAGVVLALAVMMSLTVSAWAATGNLLTGDSEADGTNIDGTSFTVTLTNDNTLASGGYRETETVTYTLKAADGTTDIAANTVSFVTPTGENPAYTVSGNTATVTFAASQNDAAASAVSVGLSFGSAITPISGQRYAKYSIVQDGSEDPTYYLYVYVKIDGTSYTPFAAILVENDSFNPEGDSETDQGYKVAGFAPTYTAQNVSKVTIRKVLGGGNNEETTKDFAFSVQVTCGDVTGADNTWSYTVTPSSTATVKSGNAGVASSINYSTSAQTFTATMRGSDSIEIAGLPGGSKVEVKELNTGNDYEHDYDVTSSVSGSKSGEGMSGSVSSATNYDDSSYQTFITTQAGTDATITFTNYRDVISPTGVVLRFAPYFAMLGAGLTTMVIAPRRKEEE